jgi:membrane protease YdiL (CAAX protease family)
MALDKVISRTIRNLVIFIFCIIAIPWLGWGLDVLRGFDSHKQDGSLGWLFFIVTPLATVVLLRIFAGDGWKDFGLKPVFKGNGKWYMFALLFHPITMLLIILIGSAFGAMAVPDASSGKFTLIGQTILLGILPSFIKNIFEEFAWRGYLTPKINSVIKQPLAGHVLVGIIWLTWHLPYYLVLMSPEVLQKSTGLSMGPFLLMGLAGIIPTAIVYGELRLWTNSVWPAVLIHVTANVFFDSLILLKFFSFSSTGAEVLFAPGLYGVLVIAVNTAAGLWLYRQRMNKIAMGATHA